MVFVVNFVQVNEEFLMCQADVELNINGKTDFNEFSTWFYIININVSHH